MRKNMCLPFDLSPVFVAIFLLLAHGLTATAARAETAGDKSDYELDVEGMIAVRFYDSVRDITGRIPQALERVEKNMSNADRYIPEAGRYKSGYSNWYPMRLDSNSSGAVRVPNFYAKDTIAALRGAHGRFMTDLVELAALNDSFVDYFKGAGAKEENFKKYTDEKTRLAERIKKARADAAKLDSLALAIALKGEARTLPKNPCGIYIINMREVIDAARQFFPILENPALKQRDAYRDRANKRPPETEDEKAARMALAADAAAKLDGIASQVSALIASHKTLDTGAIRYENKSAVETSVRALSRFYDDDGPALLENIGKISAELREKGAIRDYDRIESRMRNLYHYHDEFVGMFNIWAGGTRAMKRARD